MMKPIGLERWQSGDLIASGPAVPIDGFAQLCDALAAINERVLWTPHIVSMESRSDGIRPFPHSTDVKINEKINPIIFFILN